MGDVSEMESGDDAGSSCALGQDLTHAANLGADALELLFNALIAAIDVVDAVDHGLAVGHQRGQTSEALARRSVAHARRRHSSGVLPRTMARRPSMRMLAPMRASSCACMKRFSKMVSTMIAIALGLRHQRHVLRLQIGGEAGILFGGHVGSYADCARCRDAHGVASGCVILTPHCCSLDTARRDESGSQR